MKNIIINADDFGLNHEVNTAIIYLLKSDCIQRTTIMVNMPYVEEAYYMAKEHNLLDKIGLHINLTDGTPMSKQILNTRFCKDGQFDVDQVESGVRLHISKAEREAIRYEVLAQFEKYKELFGYYPKHVDSHRHIHNYFGFLPTIVGISKQCGVQSMRIGINLYDKKNASMAKKLYKFILNTYIRANFKSTDYMGSWLEYVDFYNGSTYRAIEIMVHPLYHEGKIVDIIYDHANEDYYDFDKIHL